MGRATFVRDEKWVEKLVSKSGGNRLLGRLRFIWEDNIKTRPEIRVL
jgi:hypothetical protein